MMIHSVRGIIRRTNRAPFGGHVFNVRTMASLPFPDFPASPDSGIPVDVTPVFATLQPFTLLSHPCDTVCHLLEAIHTVADVPYFGAIIIGTVCVRTLLLPVIVYGMKNGAKMKIISPEVTKIITPMRENKSMTVEEKLTAVKDLEALYAKHNVNPKHALIVPFIQLPIFMSMFLGLQRMGDYFPGYVAENFYGFENLATVDPTYTMPVVNSMLFLMTTETIVKSNPEFEQNPHIRSFFCAAAVVLPFFTYLLPKGVLVYMMTNSCVSISTSTLLRNPNIKKILGFP